MKTPRLCRQVDKRLAQDFTPDRGRPRLQQSKSSQGKTWVPGAIPTAGAAASGRTVVGPSAGMANKLSDSMWTNACSKRSVQPFASRNSAHLSGGEGGGVRTKKGRGHGPARFASQRRTRQVAT